MIVMKFGGTSVESAAAIERVAGIVRARLARRPVVVVSAMGKTTNRLLAIAHHAVNGHRDEAIRELLALRDYHLRESGMERTDRRAFSGTHRTHQGTGRAGRADAALDRRHLQLRRAHVEPGCHATISNGWAFTRFMSIRER